MTEIKIDSAQFWRHLQALYDTWHVSREQTDWGLSSDALLFFEGAAPAADSQDDPMFKKSVILISWLLGYEFTDTLILLTDKTTFILTSSKKAQMLAVLKEKRPNGAVELEIVVRSKEWAAQKKQLVEAIKKSFSGKKIGLIAKDKHSGPFAAQCEELTKKESDGFEPVDVSSGISSVLAIKDDEEKKLSKYAASAISSVLIKKAIPEIETAIDENKKITHDKLSEMIENSFADKQLLGLDKLANGDFIDVIYPPIIQSGGSYDLSSSAQSDAQQLHHSTIVLRIGARYKLYCSNVARTLFVNASKEHEAVYKLALEAQQKLIDSLRSGMKISSVAAIAHSIIEKSRPDLVSHLPKTFGQGIGMEFRESGLAITTKNENTVKNGMIFNVCVSISDVDVPNSSSIADPRAKLFSVIIADTVLISPEGNVALTAKCPKKWSDISYVIENEPQKEQSPQPKPQQNKSEQKQNPQKPKQKSKKQSEKEKDDDEDEDDDESDKEEEEEGGEEDNAIEIDEEEDNLEDGSNVQTRLRGREEKPASALEAEKRKAHQEELAKSKHEEAMRRINGEKSQPELKQNKEQELTNVRSYAGPNEMPSDLNLNKITVDAAHESVVLPIFGMMVPFHISTVKNVTARDDMLRINFATPVAVQPGIPVANPITNSTSTTAAVPSNSNEDGSGSGLFLREVTYRISDPKALGATELQIKEVRKRMTAKLADSKQQEEMEPQEQLKISRGSGQNPRLQDLSIQPNLTGRKTTGTLEAHTNGFRYTTNRGATVDVMYKNIRHAFFQPADQELILLLHFHLKSPIMVGKKKTKDVQFYLEVMEVSTALDRQKSHYGDAEEVEEEQREREMRRRHTANFQAFVKKVEEQVPGLEFDIPYRELGFTGAPGRGNVILQPTVKCLVNLTDTPPFVLCLDDVEIAHFERVSPSYKLRNFDLVFVFKDLARPVVRINSIPTEESLEAVKNWLDSIDIKYYEGPTNLNWNNILKTIREDVKGFLESGGWSFLEPESDDEGEMEEEEEGSDFDPDEYKAEGGEGESSSSEDEDDYSMDESASEEEEEAAKKAAKEQDDEDDDGSDEEDWSDLEKEATKSDKKRKHKDDDDDDDDDEEKAPKKSK